MTLHRKASRLKASVGSLALGAVLVGLGALVDWFT